MIYASNAAVRPQNGLNMNSGQKIKMLCSALHSDAISVTSHPKISVKICLLVYRHPHTPSDRKDFGEFPRSKTAPVVICFPASLTFPYIPIPFNTSSLECRFRYDGHSLSAASCFLFMSQLPRERAWSDQNGTHICGE